MIESNNDFDEFRNFFNIDFFNLDNNRTSTQGHIIESLFF